jgi:hypothetical protein
MSDNGNAKRHGAFVIPDIGVFMLCASPLSTSSESQAVVELPRSEPIFQKKLKEIESHAQYL